MENNTRMYWLQTITPLHVGARKRSWIYRYAYHEGESHRLAAGSRLGSKRCDERSLHFPEREMNNKRNSCSMLPLENRSWMTHLMQVL